MSKGPADRSAETLHPIYTTGEHPKTFASLKVKAVCGGASVRRLPLRGPR